MLDESLVSTAPQTDELLLETTLRPQLLADYVGQEGIKENLQVAMLAARQRGEALEHVLIHGAPGLGKTTLAAIIAREMGANLRVTSGPAIERPGDLASILTNLEPGDVLFVDEIHRLGRAVEEVLYPAMEDYAIDLVIGKGPGARTVRLDMPRFTLVGATTKVGALSSPLRDRFGVVHSLEFYSVPEMQEIVSRSAKILQIELEAAALTEIAKRSRRTPRVANRLLKRVRDYGQVKGFAKIEKALAAEALTRLEIDDEGLDRVDRLILSMIGKNFAGGPVGLDTIAAATGQDRDAVETVYEPYLLQMGYLHRTPKGRILTPAGFAHIGIVAPEPLRAG